MKSIQNQREYESESTNQTTKDASDGPHIDGNGVGCGTEQNFRDFIPENCNLVHVFHERYSEGTTEFEIDDLENPLVIVQKHILQLQKLLDPLSLMTKSSSKRFNCSKIERY